MALNLCDASGTGVMLEKHGPVLDPEVAVGL